MHEKKYNESENYFKEALKILKQAGQDKTMSYLFVLKRLAYVSFLDRRYAESEKYFRVSHDLTPMISTNPSNIFNSKKNLLLYYTYCNLEKAEELGENMIRAIDDTLPVHSKELCFLMGVIRDFVYAHLECLLLEEWFPDS